MTQTGWGIQGWGISPSSDPSMWGLGAPPEDAPILISVAPTVVELRGGTVLTVDGEQFVAPLIVEVLTGDVMSPTLVDRGFLFDPEFDLQIPKAGKAFTRALVGLPAVETAGTYHLRFTVAGVLSNLLANVLDYQLHAEEYKIQKIRSSYGQAWRTGPRVLTMAQQGGLG